VFTALCELSPYITQIIFTLKGLISILQFTLVQFIFINVSNQQPDDQLQKQHNTEAQITKEIKKDT